MFNHAPKNYICPFCSLMQGKESKYNNLQDIVHQDELVTAIVSPVWWRNNPGHVIIIPNSHFENIYDLPSAYGHRIQDRVREIAIAMKEVYKCDGVSTLQHNEPVGGQTVWHYHVHVFPRYKWDLLYFGLLLRKFIPLEKRIVYAQKLRAYFKA